MNNQTNWTEKLNTLSLNMTGQPFDLAWDSIKYNAEQCEAVMNLFTEVSQSVKLMAIQVQEESTKMVVALETFFIKAKGHEALESEVVETLMWVKAASPLNKEASREAVKADVVAWIGEQVSSGRFGYLASAGTENATCGSSSRMVMTAHYDGNQTVFNSKAVLGRKKKLVVEVE